MYRNNFANVLIGLVNFVFGIAIVGLVLRFFLRLFGANTNAEFVKFIYNSTAVLLDPFREIFTPYIVEAGNVLEFSTLFAIAIYALLAWLVTEAIILISAATE